MTKQEAIDRAVEYQHLVGEPMSSQQGTFTITHVCAYPVTHDGDVLFEVLKELRLDNNISRSLRLHDGEFDVRLINYDWAHHVTIGTWLDDYRHKMGK